MTEPLSPEEIFAFKELAQKFSQHTISSMLSAEFSDGDLSKLPEILRAGNETGLLASSENTYGIWGAELPDAGLSLELLTLLAESCAGVALCFHLQGVASQLLQRAFGQKNSFPEYAAIALQESAGLPSAAALFQGQPPSPGDWSTTARADGENYIVSGSKYFVYSGPKNEAYLVFARSHSEWALFLVPADRPGLHRESVEHRTGLRACRVEHLSFDNISLDKNQSAAIPDAGEHLLQVLYMHWLGLSAIAVGTARGALSAAQKYTAERYQGGTEIKDHAAINNLLAQAETNIFTAEALLMREWPLHQINQHHLKQVAMTKLSVMDLCARAVTDALQTFGGYGYMEDYGMEKRLRDITTLKSMAGAPLYLRRFISEL